MGFIMTLVGVALGIFLFLGVVTLIIYLKFRGTLKKLGLNVKSIGDLKQETDKIKAMNSTNPRSISGLTSILLPRIRNDFPDFNEEELYSIAETSLRSIFATLENKDTSKINNLALLRDGLKHIVEDYKGSNIDVRYNDVKFHKHALHRYVREEGIATVTVSVAVEYYYLKKKDDRIIEDFTNYKHQAKYHCDFIYIYDANKVKDTAKVLGVNCPNCGAPVKTLGHKTCDYCGTTIKEINLRSWEMASYDEV